jgi:hypothetical protein
VTNLLRAWVQEIASNLAPAEIVIALIHLISVTSKQSVCKSKCENRHEANSTAVPTGQIQVDDWAGVFRRVI